MVREAGVLALGRVGNHGDVREKPGLGPVSETDLAVNGLLSAGLLAARPGYGWLSEESEDGPARLAARRTFVVDPIDGTRAFLAGDPSWAVVVAVVEAGRPVAAVVHLPALERTYVALAGGGARCNGVPIRVTGRVEVEGARVLAAAGQMAPVHWQGRTPAVERHFRPSLAYRLCLVAGGEADAALSFRDTWEWDLVAGDLIVCEAGGIVTDRTGAEPVYNREKPILPGLIAAGPALHARIVARL